MPDFTAMPTAALVLDIISGVALFACFILLFYYLSTYRLLQKAAGAAKEKLRRESADNLIAERMGTGGQSFVVRTLKKPRQLFLYSGLSRMVPWLSFEVFLLCCMAGACVAYMSAYAVLQDMFYGLGAVGVWTIFVLGVQTVMAHRNYKVVDSNLISFLNQLANFSTVGTVEVTEVFAQVAHYMPYPLRDVLEECHAEARTSGNSAEALTACCDKLEHPKFKEIIRNLESCMRYTADYKVVVDGLRKNILDERRNAQERKSLAASAITHMLIVTVMAAVILFISGWQLDMPIREVILESFIGRLSLVFATISYIVFAWSVSRADR